MLKRPASGEGELDAVLDDGRSGLGVPRGEEGGLKGREEGFIVWLPDATGDEQAVRIVSDELNEKARCEGRTE